VKEGGTLSKGVLVQTLSAVRYERHQAKNKDVYLAGSSKMLYEGRIGREAEEEWLEEVSQDCWKECRWRLE
jgi:hypothetical protein